MSYAWEDREPQGAYGVCEECGEPFVWVLNRKYRWVAVETNSLYDNKVGHVLHFDVCKARKDRFEKIKP